MSRTNGREMSSPVSASSGIGPTSIIWCTAGVSGTEAPASPATCGLHTPQATTTCSASTRPREVCTARTRLPSTSKPVISVSPTVCSAPSSSARARISSPARIGSTTAPVGVWKPPISRSSRIQGTSSRMRSGEISSASTPQAWAEVSRRRSSCRRSGVRATSMPPQRISTSSSAYWRIESSVSSVISLEWSTGKTKFDAWPVEPPGSGSGPLSTSRMSRRPSSARCRTRLLPTMPAPITTISARSGTVSIALTPLPALLAAVAVADGDDDPPRVARR